MNFAILFSIDFMCAIQAPENWVQMIIWYLILLACLIFWAVSVQKRRKGKLSQELKEKIEYLEEFEANIAKEKAISRKSLYTAIFQITLMRDFCKETFESSQFTVYDEASKCLNNVILKLKDVEIKRWNSENNVKVREEISNELENTANYLRQAL